MPLNNTAKVGHSKRESIYARNHSNFWYSFRRMLWLSWFASVLASDTLRVHGFVSADHRSGGTRKNQQKDDRN